MIGANDVEVVFVYLGCQELTNFPGCRCRNGAPISLPRHQ